MGATRLLGAAAMGAAAGALGTVAMDLVWFGRSRAAGSDSGFVEWESTEDVTSFDDAGAPAEVGRKAAQAVGSDIPERQAGTTNDAVHWLTGAGWGMAGGLLTQAGVGRFPAGLASGVAAYASAYTVLPALGLYDPIWEYDGKTLWKDATAHLTFGAITGLGLTVLGAAAQRGGH